MAKQKIMAQLCDAVGKMKVTEQNSDKGQADKT
jgi:hypothetical protein